MKSVEGRKRKGECGGWRGAVERRVRKERAQRRTGSEEVRREEDTAFEIKSSRRRFVVCTRHI